MEEATSDWYYDPLKFDDVLAATILIVFGTLSIFFYGVVARVLYGCDKEIVGFRFLFSAAIADILILFNYTIWPATTILFKSEIFPKWSRHWVQFYLDFIWFSMCFHYVIIAWSRFAAIRYGITFRIQSRLFSYTLCGCCYLGALIQVLCTHFQSWYTIFHFDPEFYGMLSEDFTKYLNDGQSLFFACFHFLMILIPAVFYGIALFLLLKHRKNGVLSQKQARTNGRSAKGSKQAQAEVRLLIPCLLNTVFFLIGQLAITLGTGEGKWATWTILMLFSTNSAVQPVLLVLFSAVIREKTVQFFRPEISTPKRHQSSRDKHTTSASITLVNRQVAQLQDSYLGEEIRMFIMEEASTEFSTYL